LNVGEKERQAIDHGSYYHRADDHLPALVTRIPGYRPVMF